jgi:hypothetical protein
MIIKLEEINDVKIGNRFPGKEIVGTRIDDDSTWKKSFFADNRELRNQLEEFGIGDTINVKMEQEGKFWNIKGIFEADDGLIAKAQENANKYTKPAGGNATGGMKAYAPKSYAADPNKDAQIARAVALKAAIEFLGGKAKMTEEKLVESAKKFMPFLLDKDVDADKGDALDPPTVD